MILECNIEYSTGNFNLEMWIRAEGEILGISGPSGSGKSTFLDILCGLRKPAKGEIVIDGRTLFNSEKKINVATQKRGIGYVFQQGNLFPHQTVNGNIRMGSRISERKGEKVDTDEICRILEIDHLQKRSAATLSGGEKQRVALGRALAASPDVLLLDEPFNALDKERKEKLMRYLTSINRIYGVPILLVSHDRGELEQMSDTLLFLREGRILTLLENSGNQKPRRQIK